MTTAEQLAALGLTRDILTQSDNRIKYASIRGGQLVIAQAVAAHKDAEDHHEMQMMRDEAEMAEQQGEIDRATIAARDATIAELRGKLEQLKDIATAAADALQQLGICQRFNDDPQIKQMISYCDIEAKACFRSIAALSKDTDHAAD